jgi:hypothetical protein
VFCRVALSRIETRSFSGGAEIFDHKEPDSLLLSRVKSEPSLITDRPS